MGQIHPRYISLEELVQRSNLIVIANAASPFITRKMIPLAKDPKRAPPFSLETYHFQILETLHYAYAFAGAVPARIAVSDHDWKTRLMLEKEYYMKGLSRHVVWEYYESKTSPRDPGKQPVILFLYYSGRGDSAEFVVAGGHESVERKETVVRLINKMRKNP